MVVLIEERLRIHLGHEARIDLKTHRANAPKPDISPDDQNAESGEG